MKSTKLFGLLVCLLLWGSPPNARAGEPVYAQGTIAVSVAGVQGVEIPFSVNAQGGSSLRLELTGLDAEPISIQARIVRVSDGADALEATVHQVKGKYTSDISVESLKAGAYYLELSDTAPNARPRKISFSVTAGAITILP